MANLRPLEAGPATFIKPGTPWERGILPSNPGHCHQGLLALDHLEQSSETTPFSSPLVGLLRDCFLFVRRLRTLLSPGRARALFRRPPERPNKGPGGQLTPGRQSVIGLTWNSLGRRAPTCTTEPSLKVNREHVRRLGQRSSRPVRLPGL